MAIGRSFFKTGGTVNFFGGKISRSIQAHLINISVDHILKFNFSSSADTRPRPAAMLTAASPPAILIGGTFGGECASCFGSPFSVRCHKAVF
jgi:hypothetical protein